jgi:1-acyl-sn-glycerol-3-phosphate acyltransferase
MITKLFIWWFNYKGWNITQTIPAHIQKCVVVAAPHTSNWDFVYAVAAWSKMGLQLNYFIKKEVFWWPLSVLFKKTGGIPIDRKAKQNRVEAMVAAFNNRQQLIIAVSGEGTRKKVAYWKSGFYRIAQQANVPIVFGYLDYKHKQAGFSEPFFTTNNIEADLEKIRLFYADKTGKNPDGFSVEGIRFRL